MKSAFADDEDDPRYEQGIIIITLFFLIILQTGEFVAEYLRDFQRVQTRARVSGACVCVGSLCLLVHFTIVYTLHSFGPF